VWLKSFRLVLVVLAVTVIPALAAGDTYHVSSSEGLDTNDGGPGSPLQTIAKINSLALQAGDEVLFKCGDTWQGEMLTIRTSGDEANPIIFGSYPQRDCAERPVLSGSLPIEGWNLHTGDIYVADLDAGRFPNGMNQLFRSGTREPMGRWPNIDNGRSGYSFVDDQPELDQLTDNQLPAGTWTGGVVHIMGMRWYFLNRVITGTSGKTLTLNAVANCWGGCADSGGWGYFINNHLNTLDRDGEWHYDEAARKVYLYSSSGLPTQIEGSVVMRADDPQSGPRNWGVITLGQDFGAPVAYVTLDNLAVINGFRHGISTPTNYAATELHHVVIRNCRIENMDEAGVKLAVWVYFATDGRPDGWRGGHHLTVENNRIYNANHMGIDLYSRESEFTNNILQDIGIMAKANKSGIGCGYDSGGGQCTESGDGMRIKVDEPADSGHTNRIQGNRLTCIGYNGMDVFGHSNTLSQNVIEAACASKADCGGIRTYGGDSFASTSTYDITLDRNMIIEPLGSVDAANTAFNQENFAFGLYVDHYSKNVTATGNSLVRIPSTSLLYQNSSGAISDNTVYDGSRDYGRAQVCLTGSATAVTELSGNILYGIGPEARTLSIDDLSMLSSSDNNRLFQPFREKQISAGGLKTFEEWQAYSGMDSHSEDNWFTLDAGDNPLSEIFINDTPQEKTFPLINSYLDLDQNPLEGSLALPPYSSRILVYQGPGLGHCIAVLRVMAGIPDAQHPLNMADHDLDSDGKYGLADAMAMLQIISGLR